MFGKIVYNWTIGRQTSRKVHYELQIKAFSKDGEKI